MKKLTVVPFVSVAMLVMTVAAIGAVADSAVHVNRAVIRTVEKSLDERLSRVWPDTPMSVTSHTRGLYLDGFGAVFTVEMNTASDGVGLMSTILTPQAKVQIKQKKIDRMPQLQKALAQALMDAASSLDPVPLDENVVIEVDLLRYSWEDGTGYPAELLIKSTRRKLLDVKRANGVGLDTAVRVTERN
jgi:hypothetical protein